MKTALCLFFLVTVTAFARWPIFTPEQLIADFESDRFYPGPINRTGWVMEASGGREYHRADLNAQAELLADHGITAFPAAFALLDHQEGYMRYIGAKALEYITGLEPTWYYFKAPGERGTGADESVTWAGDAKRVWETWYLNQRITSSANRSGKSAASGDAVGALVFFLGAVLLFRFVQLVRPERYPCVSPLN